MNEDKKLLRSVLKESLFFKGLSEPLLEEIERIAIIKTYTKNQIIFREGEKALGFFLVLEGVVKIYKLSEKGKEHIIHLLGEGEVFSEIALSQVENYPAYAEAITPVKVAFFDKNHFLNLLKRRPELAQNLIALFSIKLRSLVKTIENLVLREAGERLLHYLWELSEEGQKKILELKINKSHLALLLGITPETLSRLFQRYQKEGLITFEKNKIILLDTKELKLRINQGIL
ncbi:MAG: Crp/Fnr family transcriptional regulator [Caldimicrobium sp.]